MALRAAITALLLLSAGSNDQAERLGTVPLQSPDGRYALVGEEQAAQLWLKDQRSQARRLVLHDTVQTMSALWAPDSRAFLVNDREASNVEDAYLYDAATLRRLNLGSLIRSADSRAVYFGVPARSSHVYVHALRWTDARTAEVHLDGHTDGRTVGKTFTPAVCFQLTYTVSRSGEVHKLSEWTGTPDNPRCTG